MIKKNKLNNIKVYIDLGDFNKHYSFLIFFFLSFILFGGEIVFECFARHGENKIVTSDISKSPSFCLLHLCLLLVIF